MKRRVWKLTTLLLTLALVASLLPVGIFAAPETKPAVDSAKVVAKLTTSGAIAVTTSGGIVYTMDGTKETVHTFKRFSDVKPGDWFSAAVADVVGKGLMNGTSETTFNPQGKTTRAMLVTILYRLAGQPKVNVATSFNDVAADSWYGTAVAWAADKQIVMGYADGTFKPDLDLTREQLVTMIYRFAKSAGQDVSARADITKYSDGKQVSSYAFEAMQWAVAKGVISGTSATTLAPQGSATRAQMATIFMRFTK